MVGSLVGATLGMVLVAACGAACHPELAGDAGRYRGELIWAARACASGRRLHEALLLLEQVALRRMRADVCSCSMAELTLAVLNPCMYLMQDLACTERVWSCELRNDEFSCR